MNKTLRILIVLIALVLTAGTDQAQAAKQAMFLAALDLSFMAGGESIVLEGIQFGDQFSTQGYLYDEGTLAEHVQVPWTAE